MRLSSGPERFRSLIDRPFIVTQSDLLTSSTTPLQRKGSPYSPRFAAPYAQRSELEASVNNALLGDDLLHVRMRANSEHAAKRVHRSTKARCLPEAVVVGKGEYFVDRANTLIG